MGPSFFVRRIEKIIHGAFVEVNKSNILTLYFFQIFLYKRYYFYMETLFKTMILTPSNQN